MHALRAAVADAARAAPGGDLRLRDRFKAMDPKGRLTVPRKAFFALLERVGVALPRSQRRALRRALDPTGAQVRARRTPLLCDRHVGGLH